MKLLSLVVDFRVVQLYYHLVVWVEFINILKKKKFGFYEKVANFLFMN